uniref:Nipped-B protein n=1 Tax=Eptatretus burgeri TaxID=7764 RepID=A0A8C4WX11_EPTBU
MHAQLPLIIGYIYNLMDHFLSSFSHVHVSCLSFSTVKKMFHLFLQVVIREKVLETLMYFTRYPDDEVQMKALIGLGFCFMQHPVLMFEPDVKALYNGILQAPEAQQSNTGPQQLIPSSALLQNQVLRNLQSYLQAEDSRMQEADRQWEKVSKQEDLKEMGDVTSGMSSSIMQLYLKNVLESFFSSQSVVRCSALNVVWLTLNQGLVHPVQCVPYLIAMGTDPEPVTRNKADQQLLEIDRKYPGFVHMKAVAGVKMAFQLQCSILRGEKTGENMRSENSNEDIVRGMSQDEPRSSMCSHLYTLIRNNRQHRRAFLLSLLSLFDESNAPSLSLLLFVADNLAHFPYLTQEEPLFLVHHLDVHLSVCGSNLLQSFRECLVPRRALVTSTLKEGKRCTQESNKEEQELEGEQKNADGEEKEKEPDITAKEEEDEREEEAPSKKEQEEEETPSERTTENAEQVSKGEEIIEKKDFDEKNDFEDDNEDDNEDDDDDDDDDDDEDDEEEEKLIRRLPASDTPLHVFMESSQGVLLLLMLKQHLKILYGFSDSKIQRYSPTESAKVYDKTVTRKQGTRFHPQQTLDFQNTLCTTNPSHQSVKNEQQAGSGSSAFRRRVVRQFLDFQTLMLHLDPDDEEEEGDGVVARGRALRNLLGNSGTGLPEGDDSDGEWRPSGRGIRESLEYLHCSKYGKEPRVY